MRQPKIEMVQCYLCLILAIPGTILNQFSYYLSGSSNRTGKATDYGLQKSKASHLSACGYIPLQLESERRQMKELK